MKRILLVIAMLAVLLMTGCNKVNTTQNNEVQDSQSNQQQESISGNSRDSLNNTLSEYDMERKLIFSVYGGYGDTPNEVVDNSLAYQGTKTRALIIDTDKNGVPEIIKFGDVYLNEDAFQLYTIKNDEVITISHMYSMFNNILNIYETDNGVFVYTNMGDGPEGDLRIYKLILDNTNLESEEVLKYRYTYNYEKDIAEDEMFFVNGKSSTIDEFNKKIEELNKYRIIDKDIFYDSKDGWGGNFKNLWDKEMFVNALITDNLKVGKEYIFTHKSVDNVTSGIDIIDGSDKLQEGEIIKIVSEKPDEWVKNGKDGFVDYEIQRENGDIVIIGEMAGRT